MPFFVFVLSLNHPHICSVDINYHRIQPFIEAKDTVQTDDEGFVINLILT